MTDLDYDVIDADTHFYEVDDCFSRHIESRYKDKTIHTVPLGEEGVTAWALGDRKLVAVPSNLADGVPGPGALKELFSGGAAPDITREVIKPREIAPLMYRAPRMELMDQQGIQAQIMLPTVGLSVEATFDRDVDALCANYRSYNRWLEEDWGYGFQDRIYSTPMVTLLDVDWAIAETVRVSNLGSKFVYIKTGPVAGRSPADPVFDRFWSTVEDTGVTVVLHIDFAHFNELYAKHWSEDPNRSVQEYSPLQMYFSMIERPIMDTMASLVLHNLFGRFPKVQILTIEWGSAWVAPLMRLTDKAAKLGGHGTWLGGPLKDSPSDILRNHLTVSPYYEDDFAGLVDVFPVDRILFGSDYPHPEGLDDPKSFADNLSAFPNSDVLRIMHDNAAHLLNLPLLDGASR